ncbi:cation transport protein-domain-containing protein [Phascolomyces articulosus]|uniref:Cation transport protein-domain-containing protein n=1 Tax=Phascolomyces articulosus TaxID=60185 RepID=A0AAD5KN40_9FUNG|nr:cation transport protein-domain-containing protein [Phascolomyces articulosus]
MSVSCFLNIKQWCRKTWRNNTKFLEIHYTYIGLLCFISSGFYYFQPGTTWNYIDALFMATSSVTNTGLNTIDMSSLSLYQLLLMFFTSILGSQVTVSLAIVLVRKHFFSKRFEDVLLFNRAQRLRERNQRQFQKNLADIHAKMRHEQQQRSSSIRHPFQNNNGSSRGSPYRSSTMPTHHRGVLPRLRSSASMALLQPLHLKLFKSATGKQQNSNNEHDAIIKEKQEIYDNLRKLREKEDKEKSIHHCHDSDTTQYDQNASLPSSMTIIPMMQRSDSSPKYSIPTTTTTTNGMDPPAGYTTSSNVLHSVTSVSTARLAEHAEKMTAPPVLPTNVAFAPNIDYQRSEARKELEHDRPYKDLLYRIAEGRNADSPLQQDMEDGMSIENAAQKEREEINNIIRSGPIHKHELTRKQRYCIGGAEYRAIDFLSKFIPIMYFTTNIVFSFALRIYIAVDGYAQQVLKTSNSTGPIDPWFFSFFTAFSSYNNLGLIPLAASLGPFVNAPAPLLLVSILIIAGNVGYAIVLRFYIWCIYKLLPRSRSMDRETLRYLLDHPRRCYTSLFRTAQTWWLVFVLITFNLTELIVFIATNYWLPVLDGIPWASRILAGYFQGVATRNAGFTAVNILLLNPGTQIIYIIAMYVSVYPVGISIRNSNVYQERELGIYSAPSINEDGEQVTEEEEQAPSKLRRFPTMNSVVSATKKFIPKRPSFYVMTQIQRTVTHEICWVIIGIFCICIIEAEAIMSSTPITALTIMYEAVSAFGNAGSSTGYPGVTTSQSGNYHTLSKLVLIILMYRGRHRGLPSAIDHAVLLPSETLEKKEECEHKLRERHAEIMAEQKLGHARWRSRTFSMV